MRDSRAGITYGCVAASFLLALLIQVFPLPHAYSLLRPEVACLVILYWVIFVPEHVGVTVAFFAGLLQDVVEGAVWGAHAIALALLAYICLVSYRRIRNYSVWHQALWVFVLVGVHQVIVNWVQGMAGYQSPVSHVLVPTAMSALCWPLVSYYLNRVRRHYRLS